MRKYGRGSFDCRVFSFGGENLVLSGYGHGGDIYRNRVQLDFSANVNPLGTPPEVREAVRKAAEFLAPYPDPYCGALRAKLAARLGVEEDAILCGNGAAELIYSFALALAPRQALVPAPSFSEYAAALGAAGCRVLPFPLVRERSFQVGEEILSAIGRDVDALILCNPNNPTGQSVDHGLLARILERCRETGCFLLLDECFLDLTDREAAFSLLPLLRSCDPVVILRAFTKLYGMAGLRLGYCVCRNPELLEKMSRFQQPWNVSTPAQAAGLAALDCGDFVRETLALLSEERRFLEAGLQELGIPFLPSKVNFLLFQGEPDWGEQLLAQGILIRSCVSFPGLTARDYRVAVRTRPENRALLAALAKLTDKKEDYKNAGK